jgi:hypothetical protein
MQQRRAVIRALLTFLLICFSCFGTLSAAPRAGDKAKEIAQKVYVQGVDHYKAGRLLEALAAFRASYDMVPSPNSHLMIARTLREHGELIEAYAEFGKVVLEADAAAARDAKYQSASLASRAERAQLRARLTMVTIFVKDPPDDLRVLVADKPIDKEHWGRPVPVLPGALVARATAAGRPEQHQDLAAVPGGDLVVTFDFGATSAASSSSPLAARGPAMTAPVDSGPFPPGNGIPDIPRQPSLPPPPPRDRTLAFVSFGVGAAGLVTFVVFGAINQSTFNSLHEQCPSGRCAPALSADVDKGRRAQTIANVGFGVALVGATVGSILLVTGANESKTEEVARRPGKPVLTDLSIGPHAVEVGGVF